jgi:hypothetical protein
LMHSLSSLFDFSESLNYPHILAKVSQLSQITIFIPNKESGIDFNVHLFSISSHEFSLNSDMFSIFPVPCARSLNRNVMIWRTQLHFSGIELVIKYCRKHWFPVASSAYSEDRWKYILENLPFLHNKVVRISFHFTECFCWNSLIQMEDSG